MYPTPLPCPPRAREQPSEQSTLVQSYVCVINALWLLINTIPPLSLSLSSSSTMFTLPLPLVRIYPNASPAIHCGVIVVFVCLQFKPKAAGQGRTGQERAGHPCIHGWVLGLGQIWLICGCACVYKVCNFIQIIIFRVSSLAPSLSLSLGLFALRTP